MDKKGKQINISNNLLVGLKAELLRKQAGPKKPVLEKVVGRSKTKETIKATTAGKKEKINKKSKKSNDALSIEEIHAWEKSKQALEKKARLYDQMNQDVLSMEDSSNLPFLVDFEQKAIDDFREGRSRGERARSEDERMEDSEEEGGDWVDYTDSLGRSRRCLKQDLPHFEEMDRKFAVNLPPKPPAADPSEPQLLSDDMRREMERQKWEEEVKRINAKDDIHYSDITFNEIRDHGVGFFNFSKDEDMRKKQLELLNELREQTKRARKTFASEKEKKRKMLEIRLAKVMQRKVVQEAMRVSGLDAHALIAGIKGEEWSEEVKDDEEVGGLIGSEPQVDEDDEEEKVKPIQRDDSWRRDAPVREWDVGKKTFDEDAWLDERRTERVPEFAPVYPDSSARRGADADAAANHVGPADELQDSLTTNLKKLRMLIS